MIIKLTPKRLPIKNLIVIKIFLVKDKLLDCKYIFNVFIENEEDNPPNENDTNSLFEYI